METQKLSGKDVAQLFGLTTRRIRQLREDGVIRSEGSPGKYDLIETVQSYIKHLSSKANGKKQKDNPELEKDKLDGEARIKQAKAEMAELELREMQGELHRAEDVEAITTDHVLYFRSMLMALPGKLAVDLAGTHTAAEQAARVKKEINFVLDSLADYKYDPDEYARRVRERQGWKDRDDGDA
ncbi:MAG: protoporphyrinogen oxidase [Peptococcaceae bacterium]|nr:protoporphyrinogen oxidase [Peptococcaceae bacterium]